MKSKKLIRLLTVIVCFPVLGFSALGSLNENMQVITDEDDHALELSPEEIDEIGLETEICGSGTIDIQVSLIGEINLNRDMMAYIVPRVEGIVTEITKKLGDNVKAGEIAAVIESIELADAKADYLAAVEIYEINRLTFEREEKLWKEKISSEQDYLDKKQALTKARIEMRTAEQKLRAIGFDESYIKKLLNEPDMDLTRFELKAPFRGTIIQKNLVFGERVSLESTVFVIADLNSVWIDLQVFPKDIVHIRKGQQVIISTDTGNPDETGIIDYVGPIVGTESRTALVRATLANKSGVLRPGLFVDAKVSVSRKTAEVVVPKESIQTLEGRKCVFIKDEHDFEPVFIEIGLEDTNYAEILSGLTAGQEYVTKGAFSLKSKIVTSTLDSHAGHGH